MRIFKTLIAAAALALCGISTTASAQECGGQQGCVAEKLGYKPYPYGFVQLQGGVGTTLTDVNMFKIMHPTVSLAGGYMFTPAVGARLHVNGIHSVGGLQMPCGVKKYKYNYINTNADLMVNVLNVFRKVPYSPFNLYLVGGIGLNYAWDNDEFEDFVAKADGRVQQRYDISNAWGDKQSPRHSLLSHNIRAGLLADYNLCKNWSVGVEVDMNSLDDRFNSKYNNSDDWMLTAQVSVTYKFGFKKCNKPEPKPEPVVVEQKPEPKPEPKPVVKPDEPLHETFFYQIRESDPDSEATLNKIVAWCKKYSNKKITVDGYADRGTGNPKINAGYAKARAEKVAQKLQDMGVPAEQMIVNSYGDTVQPFAENDKNRCTIVIGGK